MQILPDAVQLLQLGGFNHIEVQIARGYHHIYNGLQTAYFFLQFSTVTHLKRIAWVKRIPSVDEGLAYHLADLTTLLCKLRQPFFLGGSQFIEFHLFSFPFLLNRSEISFDAMPLVIWSNGKTRCGNNRTSIFFWPVVTGLPCHVACLST